MRRCTGRVSFTVLCAVGFACCAGESNTSQRAAPRWTLSAEPLLRIGQADGPTGYLFETVSAASLLDDGRVVVADAGSANIRVFNVEGDLTANFGRRGEGPGEFGWLGALEVRGDSVRAYDPSLMRLTVFGIDGTIIDTRRLETGEGAPEVFAGTFSSGEVVAGAIQAISRDPAQAMADQWTVGVYDQTGALRERLAVANGYVRLQGRPVPFSPRAHVLVHADSVIVGDASASMVTVFDSDGTPARTFNVDLPQVRAAEAREELAAAIAASGEENRFFDEIAQAAWAEEVPSFAGVLLESSGRIWVKHYSPGTDSWIVGGLTEVRGGRWTILDLTGVPVAEIQIPDQMVLMDVSQDRVVAVERDAFGVEQVVVFEIER